MVLRRHAHDDESVVATEASSIREPFGIGQAVCVALGVFFLVVGAIGLARTGMSDLTGQDTVVAGMAMTGALALIHLGIGVLALIGAASRSAARGMLMVLGPALIAVGIIALIEPVEALGWNDTGAIVYLVTGGIALVGAIMTPSAVIAERRHDAGRFAA